MIEATYSISKAEFTQADSLWCGGAAKKVPGYIVLLITYVVCGACIGWSLRYLPVWLWSALLLSLWAARLILDRRRKFIRKQQYEHFASRASGVHVVIDESGYRDEKPECCNGWNAWGGYTGWKEGPLVFVLGRHLQFTPIPKAPFSTEQQSELRQLLEAKLGPAQRAR
ncbi:MAG: hypothetical protein WB439_02055 [Acidobacteriaceae bacterium]